MKTFGNSFVVRIIFLWRDMTKNWRKLELFFLIFCCFSFFSVFSKVSEPIMTCLLFFEHLDTLFADGNFSLDLYAFEILETLITFSIFLVKVVFKSLIFVSR